MRNPQRRAWPGWAAWALWTFNIFYLASFPRGAFPRLPSVLPWDKIVHAIEWAIWTGLLFVTLLRHSPRMTRERLFATTTLLAAAGGVLHEVQQIFVPGRSCDPADWIADMTGAVLVAFCGALLLPALRRWFG